MEHRKRFEIWQASSKKLVLHKVDKEQVDYYFDSNIPQSEKLKMMDLTESQVQKL